MGERLRVYEVGPRDGLQNEKRLVAADDKRRLVESLLAAGLRDIEATSFVNPRAVPQMADADALWPTLRAPADGRLFAAVMNERGYDRAIAAGARSVAVVLVVTDSLGVRNSRMTVKQGLASCRAVMARGRADGVHVRVYLAPAWVCPYEGAVPPERILHLLGRVAEEGVDEVALADTIGHAHPLEVGRLCEQVGARIGMERLGVHLHDTLALGLANAAAAIAAGVRTVDASIGGLGGCPFAPGAAGNLATEDLVLMAHKMGFHTGIDLEALASVVDGLEALVGRRVGGRTRAR
jgi:hydroxymethylglutaryl-CoA lyase